jgi:hypothetical protein
MYLHPEDFSKVDRINMPSTIVFNNIMHLFIWLPVRQGDSNLKFLLVDQLFLKHTDIKVLYSKVDFSQTIDELKTNCYLKMFIGDVHPLNIIKGHSSIKFFI